jgi:hypothetical protein
MNKDILLLLLLLLKSDKLKHYNTKYAKWFTINI